MQLVGVTQNQNWSTEVRCAESRSRFWGPRARPAEQQQLLEAESSARKPNLAMVRLRPGVGIRLLVLRGPITPAKGKEELQKLRPSSS